MKCYYHWLLVFIFSVTAAFPSSKYLSELPTPQRVMQDIQGTSDTDTAVRQCAAFEALEDEISFLEYHCRDCGSPLPREGFPKFKAYYEAYTQIMARWRPGAKLVDFEVSEEGRNFQRGILQKYLSQGTLNAGEAAAKAKRAHDEAQASGSANATKAEASSRSGTRLSPLSMLMGRGEQTSRQAPSPEEAALVRIAIGLVFIGIAMLVVPPLLGPRSESAPPLEGHSNEALELPESLRHIQVYRKQYDVWAQSGLIYDKEVWTETHVSTTTSGGGYTPGGNVYSTPLSTSTHVSSTVNHRYWLRTPDGREIAVCFSDDQFPATKGQVITVVRTPNNILIAFNHATSQMATKRSWFRLLHWPPMGKLWLVSMVLWAVGCYALTPLVRGGVLSVELPDYGDVIGIQILAIGTLAAATFSFTYLAFYNFLIRHKRNRQFEKRYVPEFRKLFHESTTGLLKCFTVSPSTP